MGTHFNRGRRWITALVAVGALSLAVAPASADPKGKGHRRHHAVKVYRPQYKYARPHYAHKVYHRWVNRVRCSAHGHYYCDYCSPYPVWVGPRVGIYHFDDDPFYFHASLGVYFGSGAFHIAVGDYAPRGYAYFDPFCDVTFTCVSDYRTHLHRHRHEPLLDLVVINRYGDRDRRDHDDDDEYYYDDYDD